MSPHNGETLRRIAAANRQVQSGTGLDQNHFIPACSINNRATAAKYKQSLFEEDVLVKVKQQRLCTRFFVPTGDLTKALRIHKQLLQDSPDIAPRKFSRDYDGIFLLTPFTLLAALITYLSPLFSDYIWIGVVTSGFTAMMIWERLNRQYRYQSMSRWGSRDLLWATAAAALNIAVWQAVV